MSEVRDSAHQLYTTLLETQGDAYTGGYIFCTLASIIEQYVPAERHTSVIEDLEYFTECVKKLATR